jgi:dCMP deaminase
MTDWDRRFLHIAAEVATWSKDPNEKVGCVIVDPSRRRTAFGFNGFPPGIKDDSRLYDKVIKNRIINHAERNALDNLTFDPTGCTLYSTRPPCVSCAKGIITQRLNRVVAVPVRENSRWAEEHEFAKSLLEEAGVLIQMKEL